MEFIFGVMMIAAMIILKKRLPIIRGRTAERKVARTLQKLAPQEYFAINDFMAKTETGTTQIDHIVVSKYGIFVLETKNYRGWITGSEWSREWIKNVYGNKYRFQNPLHQNFGHIKALEQILKIEDDKFVSIVVFTNRANLKVETSQHLIYRDELLKTIQEYQMPVLCDEEVKEALLKLNEANITDKETRKHHVESIKERKYDTQEKIRSGICPKCGGTLVLRHGKYGNFYGCSNYPTCRFTKQV